ncbi:MAG: XdhC family protein [Oligoflexia bacterium]|nr:XdhC family protein [Oligoflexia bacterium]
MIALFKSAIEQLQKNQPIAIITLIKVKGSAPQIPGAKMLIVDNNNCSDHLSSGTIGGGNLEFTATKEALNILRDKNRESIYYYEKNLKNDLGMVCGGEVHYTIEIINPATQLIICGAGHCGHSLYQMALNLNFSITIIDSMTEYANKERYPAANNIINSFQESDLDCKLNLTSNNPNSFIVILTRDHQTDFKLVRYFLNKNWSYLGLIASKNKAHNLRKELEQDGYPLEKINKLTAPIGLSIGGSSPAELAISILAQIIQLKNGCC